MNRIRPSRIRRRSTRDRILDDLKRSLRDTLQQAMAPAKVCACDDCRLARAVDVTPDPRVLQVTSKDYERMETLAADLGWSHAELAQFTHAMFQKQPALLREREAGAIIAHLERRDV